MSVTRASDTTPLTVSAVLQRVMTVLSSERALTGQSQRRLAQLMERFASYLEQGSGLSGLGGVLPEHASSFVRATSSSGSAPSVATMHLRRSAVRLLFATARHLGLTDSDPTLDLELPPRSSVHQRPLTDDEIALCRSFALSSLTETRQPAAFALAEATARTSEIPHILISDVDLDGFRVWIHGGSKTEARWGKLTPWGARQLVRRVAVLRRLKVDGPPLVYSGRAKVESAQASSCIAISEIFKRAGLGSEPDVRPGSVAAWAGATAFASGQSVDEVARMLGVRSLDRAARLIGWDWRPGEEA